ncbi:cystathionine gamma-synthase [Terricaulis sp.]|uniref:cystathionine gamma-synthase n=1 Tax=Terricaulis sp. TaxID=2768686 RepID=UPI002AC665D0|nr:cystathionine gamma-synthase [Terricaulis sp.]MDZ4692232.1 cystathionine gamma-synthase [Terricaulis sp.]
MTQFDETILCSAGINDDAAHGAVIPPLYLSANYSFDGYGGKRAYDYTRSGNPTRDVLGKALAALEGGAGAVVTSSGMSAVDLVLNLLPGGARVVAPHDCYGGTWRLFTARAAKRAIEIVFVDQGDADALAAALPGAALVWIETPSNPLMRVVDIAAIAASAKAAGARVAVDNTFLSPALQKPIALGADFVVHSTTKYLNGHSDVVGGAVIAANVEDAQQLTWWANCTGVTGSPFDAWLTLRGLRTLSVRIKRQACTAHRVAEALAAHPRVRKIYYPGLTTHPSHDIAARQQIGFGAMLSFELEGDESDVRALLAGLHRFTLAESLGGVESLIAHPASMTHASMTSEARRAAGIDDTLLRISIGLEHEEDLLADLLHALDALESRGQVVQAFAHR